jgi:hypothetical protein
MAGRLTVFLAVLALAGCDLGDGPPERSTATASEATVTAHAPTPTQPSPSRTELVVQAIRSCEVKRIVFLHSGKIWITFPWRDHDSHEEVRHKGGRARRLGACRSLQHSHRHGVNEAGATGLEPATSGVTGRRSNQLNYAPAREALYRRLRSSMGGDGIEPPTSCL